jgi:Tfp pilus assembly protein PilO
MPPTPNLLPLVFIFFIFFFIFTIIFKKDWLNLLHWEIKRLHIIFFFIYLFLFISINIFYFICSDAGDVEGLKARVAELEAALKEKDKDIEDSEDLRKKVADLAGIYILNYI